MRRAIRIRGQRIVNHPTWLEEARIHGLIRELKALYEGALMRNPQITIRAAIVPDNIQIGAIGIS